MVNTNLTPAQIKRAIEQLPMKKREKLLRYLQQNMDRSRLKDIAHNVRQRRQKLNMTDREISEMINQTRKEFYARRR